MKPEEAYTILKKDIELLLIMAQVHDVQIQGGNLKLVEYTNKFGTKVTKLFDTVKNIFIPLPPEDQQDQDSVTPEDPSANPQPTDPASQSQQLPNPQNQQVQPSPKEQKQPKDQAQQPPQQPPTPTPPPEVPAQPEEPSKLSYQEYLKEKQAQEQEGIKTVQSLEKDNQKQAEILAEDVTNYLKSDDHKDLLNTIKTALSQNNLGKDIGDGINQALKKVNPQAIFKGIKESFSKELELDQKALQKMVQEPNPRMLREARWLLGSFVTFTALGTVLGGSADLKKNFNKSMKRQLIKTLVLGSLDLLIELGAEKAEILKLEKEAEKLASE